MIFNSVEFAIFLPLVLAVWWAMRTHRSKLAVLLVASYIFYGWWDPRFLSLILISTIADFTLARRIAATDDDGLRRRLMATSVAINLGILGLFKYANFFIGSLDDAFGTIGIDGPSWTLKILLPVGISFYTFQTMSYTIDVYRRRIAPTDDLLTFSVYVSFFPQLVAGPIERAHHLLPQFQTARPPPNRVDVRASLVLVLQGLTKKVVIADGLAGVVQAGFDRPGRAGWVELTVATLAFALQIYGDFSGYTDIARGSARLFGIDLIPNFDAPYLSRNITEFWRRWHISLSNWLRDYLYIPLGGNRGTRLQTERNLLLTMLLGGLWHGASWTFVVWGGLHGLYLAAERLARELMGDRSWYSNVLFKLAMALLTYFLINITWVFFRAQSFDAAMTMLASMFALAAEPKAVLRWTEIVPAAIVVSGMVATHWMMRSSSLEAVAGKAPRWLIGAIWAFMLFMLVITQGSDSAFIYFQF